MAVKQETELDTTEMTTTRQICGFTLRKTKRSAKITELSEPIRSRD